VSLFVILAAASAVPAAQPADASAKPAESIICRFESEGTSRIPIRICRTQAEWDAITKANRDDLEHARNNAKNVPFGGPH
jgi:hypothetical protein